MPPVKKKINHESEIKTPSYGLLKLGGISEVWVGISPKKEPEKTWFQPH